MQRILFWAVDTKSFLNTLLLPSSSFIIPVTDFKNLEKDQKLRLNY